MKRAVREAANVRSFPLDPAADLHIDGPDNGYTRYGTGTGQATAPNTHHMDHGVMVLLRAAEPAKFVPECVLVTF